MESHRPVHAAGAEEFGRGGFASAVILEREAGAKANKLRLHPDVDTLGLGYGASPLAADSVEMRVKAVSLNFRDVVHAKYLRPKNLPFIPCSDCVGEVIKVGRDVRDLRVGDRVCPLFFPHWKAGHPETFRLLRGALGGANALEGGMTQGVLRATLRAKEAEVVKVPNFLTDEEASTLPCAGLTAYCAVRGGYEYEMDARRKKGVKRPVMLVEGTGGVSLFALQFATALGCKVICTSSRSFNRICIYK